ncbi:hypothetical protein BDQ17DRAFT_122089 [Cyathus striatus]|nr:hypothetical protein BDQ17DRAFT_122089 [Cyathus striatus]
MFPRASFPITTSPPTSVTLALRSNTPTFFVFPRHPCLSCLHSHRHPLQTSLHHLHTPKLQQMRQSETDS